MKLAIALALAAGTAIAALPLAAHAGFPIYPPTPMLADVPRQIPEQMTVAPPASVVAPMEPAVPSTVQATAREVQLRTDLAAARNDLSRGLRVAAERRLDRAATELLNVQQLARDGDQQATPYDTSVTDVIAAYRAARQGDLATAGTMVNGAIQALPTSS